MTEHAPEFADALVKSYREWSLRLSNLPPMVRCIHCHPDVPVGDPYRQWDTNGELHLWVNDWTVKMMPVKTRDEVMDIIMAAPPMFGTPVVFER